MSGRIILEICADTPAGLYAAIAGGADRIELCAALELGGLTPSAGLMRHAATAGRPCYAMIRPRGGDFVFDARDLAVMHADIDAARAAGLRGVVLGASRPDGTLDRAMLTPLADHAREQGLGLTLHRAFDLTADRAAALEMAVALGFERILTSGAASDALAGAPVLADLVARAGSRIAIMAGGGVNADNAAAIIAACGIGELHASCRGAPIRDARAEQIAMALGARQDADPDRVRRLRTRIDAVQ